MPIIASVNISPMQPRSRAEAKELQAIAEAKRPRLNPRPRRRVNGAMGRSKMRLNDVLVRVAMLRLAAALLVLFPAPAGTRVIAPDFRPGANRAGLFHRFSGFADNVAALGWPVA